MPKRVVEEVAISARSSSRPTTGRLLNICALGWLIPGCGHLLLGRRWRALILFVAILTTFLFGVLNRDIDQTGSRRPTRPRSTPIPQYRTTQDAAPEFRRRTDRSLSRGTPAQPGEGLCHRRSRLPSRRRHPTHAGNSVSAKPGVVPAAKTR